MRRNGKKRMEERCWMVDGGGRCKVREWERDERVVGRRKREKMVRRGSSSEERERERERESDVINGRAWRVQPKEWSFSTGRGPIGGEWGEGVRAE